jgi:hypothetical protein
MAYTTHHLHSVLVVGTIRRLATVCVWMVGIGLTSGLGAGVLYWDTNSTSKGSSTTTGTWIDSGTSATAKSWTSDSAGRSATVVYVSGSDAVFSAGTNVTGAYTVTLNSTQNVSSILVEDGNPTISGTGTVNFMDSTPDLTINSNHTLTLNTLLTSSNNSLNLMGSGTLSLGQATTLTGTLDLGGSGLAGTTLQLNAVNLTVGTLNVTANSTIDFAGTAATLNVTNLSIATGVTLTIKNWANAVDYFYASNWSGATPDLSNAAPMNQVVFTGFTAANTKWQGYDHQITPVPEPATYGVLLLGSLTLLLAWRRRPAGAQRGPSPTPTIGGV